MIHLHTEAIGLVDYIYRTKLHHTRPNLLRLSLRRAARRFEKAWPGLGRG